MRITSSAAKRAKKNFKNRGLARVPQRGGKLLCAIIVCDRGERSQAVVVVVIITNFVKLSVRLVDRGT